MKFITAEQLSTEMESMTVISHGESITTPNGKLSLDCYVDCDGYDVAIVALYRTDDTGRVADEEKDLALAAYFIDGKYEDVYRRAARLFEVLREEKL